jgi:hypothetical protein
MMPSIRFALLSLLVACGGGDGTGEASSEVTGAATYRDAETDLDGNATDPAAPPSQSVRLLVTIEGEGTLPEIDPECALDPAGRFEAHYTGTAELSGDAAYAALFGETSGQFVTPSGCEIPDLTVGLITGVTIRGELTATTENCDTYCSAEARADAEASCGATSSAAQCRTDAEAAGKATCVTECTTQTDVIVAETTISATALGDLDADALRAAAFGDLEANLVFDRME